MAIGPNVIDDCDGMTEDKYWRGMDEEHAVQRLMAAAPDLLKALQYAVEQVPELATVPGIAAAMAKALGHNAEVSGRPHQETEKE